MMSPKILSTHAVRGYVVTRFRTRFGGVTWLLSDPTAPGHGGFSQGTAAEVISSLRSALLKLPLTQTPKGGT